MKNDIAALSGMKILEGSRAIAETVNNCGIKVVSAYPITPQTHIVEELAKIKAEGEGDFEYIRAESEFAAISIIEGASATGVRTYTATSAQGLLLMTEVLFNIAGMRLPIVMTDANRAVSAPINIWCFAKEAQVLMADLTYKPIAKIKVGDLVLGKDKQGNLVFTKVKKLFKRKTDRLIKLKTKEFDLICTPEHQFYYHSAHNHWTKAKSLLNKELHWFGFGVEENKEFKRGWLAGVAAGDGCFYRQGNRYGFRLKVKDVEMVDYFVKWSNECGFEVQKKRYMEEYGYYIAALTMTKTTDRFEKFLRPKENMDFARGYLAGLYDAEGTGPHKIKQAVIYNDDVNIINLVKSYLNKLNFSYKVYIDKRSDNYHVKINNVPEFFIKCRPVISRKRDNVLRMTLKSIKSRLRIEKIEDIDIAEIVYNFETESNNYIVNGLLVHNCDQQDAVTMRDAGWIMLYGETVQEACDLHILAYKVAEQSLLPVMINMDGFILTHVVEPVIVESAAKIRKYLPDWQPKEILDVNNPLTLGAFATPAHYFEIRKELHDDLAASEKIMAWEMKEFKKVFGRSLSLAEYSGPKNAETVIVAMGSVLGTIREALIHKSTKAQKHKSKIGILKISCLRPFPDDEVIKYLSKAKNVIVIDKSISLGSEGILATEIRRALYDNSCAQVTSIIMGLGGRDITMEMIAKAVEAGKKAKEACVFIGS